MKRELSTKVFARIIAIIIFWGSVSITAFANEPKTSDYGILIENPCREQSSNGYYHDWGTFDLSSEHVSASDIDMSVMINSAVNNALKNLYRGISVSICMKNGIISARSDPRSFAIKGEGIKLTCVEILERNGSVTAYAGVKLHEKDVEIFNNKTTDICDDDIQLYENAIKKFRENQFEIQFLKEMEKMREDYRRKQENVREQIN